MVGSVHATKFGEPSADTSVVCALTSFSFYFPRASRKESCQIVRHGAMKIDQNTARGNRADCSETLKLQSQIITHRVVGKQPGL